jgi:hypothetical protein
MTMNLSIEVISNGLLVKSGGASASDPLAQRAPLVKTYYATPTEAADGILRLIETIVQESDER